jgi:hypothetical protein
VKRVVIIAMTALLCVACGQQDRQAAPVLSDVSPASATPLVEGQEAVFLDEATGFALASVNAFVGTFDLSAETTMRGQFRSQNRFLTLYSLVGCEYGCRGSEFALPVADGPLTRLPAGTDTVQWSLTDDSSFWPPEEPTHVYPGQVYFTAVQGGTFTRSIKELGFTEIPLGEKVGPGIRSFKVPGSWPAPVNPYVGELRLFPLGAKLPAAFVPADGRVVAKDTELGRVLGFIKFPLANGRYVVPTLAPVDGYQWAIAARGFFPVSVKPTASATAAD